MIGLLKSLSLALVLLVGLSSAMFAFPILISAFKLFVNFACAKLF